MSFENLLLERDGAVAVLTINRLQLLNALNASIIDQLRRAVWISSTTPPGLIASTDDMHEGTTAFLEKRKADFKGR